MMETYRESPIAFCWTEGAADNIAVNEKTEQPVRPRNDAVGIFTNREQDLALGLETLGDHPYAQVWAQAVVGTMGREVQRWQMELEHIEDKLAYYQDAQHQVGQRLADAEKALARMESMLSNLEAKHAMEKVHANA